MLDNLINLVKEHAGDAIINNPVIPNERNDEAIATTSGSIVDSLKNAAQGGGLQDIMQLFQGGQSNAGGLLNNISGNVVQSLISKFGIDQQQAGGIAGGLIPGVLQSLVSKTNDPNDSSFDLKDILSNIGGGNLDIGGILNQFTGGGSNNSGGGLMDGLKGLFK